MASVSETAPVNTMSTDPDILSLLSDHLYVPDQKRYVRIRQSEIMLVKGARSSVELVLTGSNRRAVSTHLSQFRSYLNPVLFVQVSRSYIVNLLYVESIQPGRIEVGGQTIPVSASYRDAIRKRLTLVRLRSEVEGVNSPAATSEWEVDPPDG